MLVFYLLQLFCNIFVQVDHLLFKVFLLNLQTDERVQVLHDETNLGETVLYEFDLADFMFWDDVANVALQN